MRLKMPAVARFVVLCTLITLVASCNRGRLSDPSGFTPVAGVTTVSFSWNRVSDATGYTLERKIGSGQFSQVFNQNQTSYQDTGLQPNTSYTYRLRATKGSTLSAGVTKTVITVGEGNPVSLSPFWLSKQAVTSSFPTGGEIAAIKTAPDNVSVSGSSLTMNGSGSARYALGSVCTKVTASVSGSGGIFRIAADNKELWSGTSGATGNIDLVGKQQLSLAYQGTGTGTWTGLTVYCSSTPAPLNSKAVAGEWLPAFDWGGASPIVPTHAANLPDGRIVTWASWKEFTYGYKGDGTDCSEGASLGYCEETEGFIWDYKTNAFQESDNANHDMFCAGLAVLPDGRIFGGGGGSFRTGNGSSNSGPADSQYKTSYFDFKSNAWDEGTDGDMEFAHWYGTAVAMPDSRIFMIGGASGDYTAEILNRPDNGVWNGLTQSDGENNNVLRLYAEREETIIPNPVPGATSADVTFAQNQEFSEVNQWYPFLNVAPDGTLFQSGPIPRLHNVTLNGSSGISVATTPGDTIPASHAQMRTFGNSIMFNEGKILVTGGSSVRGAGGTKSAMIMDINGAAVDITTVPDMRYPRTHHNTVVLPTGEVLVVGGNNSGKQFTDAGYRATTNPSNANDRWPTDMATESVLTPELFDPGSNTWRDLNDMTVPRNYHSVGILLQDGTVLAAGGGLCGDDGPSGRQPCNHPDGQVFKPPYLFKSDGTEAARPAIQSVSGSNVTNDGSPLSLPKIGYNRQFTVTMNSLGEGSSISRFTLIKLSSVTHSINTDVRFLEVGFSGSDKSYTLTTDEKNTVLTPGYYFLFAINDKGVPSVAQVVQIN
jgi:hypothetical protein